VVILYYTYIEGGRALEDSINALSYKAHALRPSQVSQARKCTSFYNSTEFANVSRSLRGEEVFLHDQYFKGVCRGTYVELGAHDGVGQDNTLAFNSILNWTGVLIEPSPTRFKSLQTNRPDDVLINKAVCNKPGHVHFIDKRYVGGIYEFMNNEFLSRWHSNIDVNALPTISCSPLSSLVRDSGTFFDFLSLDVEGGEYEVLQTMGNVKFGVILVESDGRNPRKDYAVRSLLEAKGYMFDGKHNNSQWFVNKQWHEVYVGIIY
jgi:FkbM family methyltransferase